MLGSERYGHYFAVFGMRKIWPSLPAACYCSMLPGYTGSQDLVYILTTCPPLTWHPGYRLAYFNASTQRQIKKLMRSLKE